MTEEDAPVTEEVDSGLVDEAEAESLEAEQSDEAEELDAEASQEESDEPSDSSSEKKKDSFQDRIDEVTQKFRAEERQRLMMEQQNRQLSEQLQAMQQPRQLAPDKTLADFDYDEAAFAQYVGNFARQTVRAEVQHAQQRMQMNKANAEFAVKEQDFAKSVEDYSQVTRNPSLPITQTMVNAVQSTEKGPEILYYLGKNPDVAMSLANMHPIDMAREIGHIEATKLVKPESPPKEPAKPAPKIPATTTARKINPTEPASDKLSDEEWLKRRNKQVHG